MFRKKELKKRPFIIAEVGQNHQGSLINALKYVKTFSEAGADAIKFQTRNNRYLFDKNSYNAMYNSENAFAKTYGKHREHLELSLKELFLIKKECKKFNVKFICTPFDEYSLKNIIKLDVDAIKIASFDLGNLPFIKLISELKKPVIISLGGGKNIHIEKSIKLLRKKISDLAILHCVSEYPCEAHHLGLNEISKLSKKYKEFQIGLSDHYNGILSGPVAYLKGARIFEKHVTLNRSWKGTDHSFALERDGFVKFVRDLHRVELMERPKNKNLLGKEAVFQKLGKSLIVNKNLKKGTRIKIQDLSGKIFTKIFIPVRDSYKVIGKKLVKSKKQFEEILTQDFK
jgi:sialic acid synthase